MTPHSMRLHALPLPTQPDERLQRRLIHAGLAEAAAATAAWWTALAYGLWSAIA